MTPPTISAVIPIYQPEAKILNRCLYLVTPQVSEVIVTMEGNSVLPQDALKHPNIHHVQTEEKGIGFGRNVNFGCKHATGDWLLILNDDVHLNEDAVAEMLKVAYPDTGIVVHLLRYPDRRIFATVCERYPGANDFHHVDHLKLKPTLEKVVEVENACGASWLIRREAFDQVNGYDERFHFYCEDNDLSLRIRRAGWKIFYTPHAKGWHIGHQSTRKIGNLSELMKPSVTLFHLLWQPYIQWNKSKPGLGNFDYLKHDHIG